MQQVGNGAQIAQRAGLQHLELQLAGRQLGVACQRSAQFGHKIGLRQLHGVDVDAHRQAQPSAVPLGDLLQRALEHPVAHVHHQRLLLQRRHKSPWGEQAALRVLPADQRLDPDHGPAAHIDLGLVIEHELLLLQRQRNLSNLGVAAAQAPVVLGVEQVVAVFAALLGLEHGLVGLAQQLVGVHRIGLGVEANP